jgi:hypothetical protein
VIRKLVFPTPYMVPAEPSRFASSVITPRGYNAGSSSCATYIFPHDLPLSPNLLPYG